MTNPIYRLPVTVEASSIDILGHVNNREYMRWMENAATLHAASRGQTFEALKTSGFAWVVRQHWIEYLKPALLGDNLDVYTWVQTIRRISSLRRYAIMRQGELLTVGATEWVFVDYARRCPVAIPPNVKEGFQLLSPEAPELHEMGISRMVRFAPSASL